MRVLSCIIMAVFFLAPRSTSAIQLRWLSGATDLTFSSATRGTLVLQADSAEVALPSSWRLQWIADSSGIQFVASTGAFACAADTAKIDSIWGPSTPADSAANEITARFCSGGSGSANIACSLLDLVAGSKGRLKVVALDAVDTTQVIESNEVTYNGGVTGDYSPTILSITVSHEGSPLRISAAGTSLDHVTSVKVLTPDTTWTIPLTIQAQTDASLTATGTMTQALQGSTLLLSSGTASVSSSPVPDDEVLLPPPSEEAYGHFSWIADLNSHVRPKDFGFIYNTVWTRDSMWEGVYHVFYIRHFDTIDDDDQNEKSFGHAWWRPRANTWRFDTTAFRCAGAPWDSLHVWAPSIIFRGGQYVMYYTGVDKQGNQRIGYATTSKIDTSNTTDADWHRQSTPVFRAGDAGWTDKGAPQQCRDPYVMPNPDGTGVIMVYAAMDAATRATAVGLAKSPTGLGAWVDAGHYVVTDSTNSHARRVESPHMFADSVSAARADSAGVSLGQVPNVTWRIMFTDGDYTDSGRRVLFVTNSGSALTDTSFAAWSQPGPTSLWSYARQCPDGYCGDIAGLQATECLRAGKVYVLAGIEGFNGGFGISFRRQLWPSNPDFAVSPTFRADVTAVRETQRRNGDFRFAIASPVPAHGGVRLRIEAAAAMRARVVVYDVMGRALKRILDQAVPAGMSYLSWDGRSESGKAVASGIYFARLSSGGRSRVAPFALIR